MSLFRFRDSSQIEAHLEALFEAAAIHEGATLAEIDEERAAIAEIVRLAALGLAVTDLVSRSPFSPSFSPLQPSSPDHPQSQKEPNPCKSSD